MFISYLAALCLGKVSLLTLYLLPLDSIVLCDSVTLYSFADGYFG